MKKPDPELLSLYREIINDDATWVDALFWYVMGVISASSVILAAHWI